MSLGTFASALLILLHDIQLEKQQLYIRIMDGTHNIESLGFSLLGGY
jgi:hypothetical protein